MQVTHEDAKGQREVWRPENEHHLPLMLHLICLIGRGKLDEGLFCHIGRRVVTSERGPGGEHHLSIHPRCQHPVIYHVPALTIHGVLQLGNFRIEHGCCFLAPSPSIRFVLLQW